MRHEEILKRGPVPEVVLDVIQKKKIDLLVLGTHGRTGFKKIVMGSVAEELFRRAPCPVLTVGPSAVRTEHICRFYSRLISVHRRSKLCRMPLIANKTGGELILLHLGSPFPVDYVGLLWRLWGNNA